jgi:hypothetical protein
MIETVKMAKNLKKLSAVNERARWSKKEMPPITEISQLQIRLW